MSRTDHHRKPGAPRKPRKGYIAQGRAHNALTRAMFAGNDLLDVTEPMATRRTR